jgi:hypothetical protein
MTATVTELASRRKPKAERPHISEVTIECYKDGRVRGLTTGIDLSCPQSRAAAVRALRAIANCIEEMSR